MGIGKRVGKAAVNAFFKIIPGDIRRKVLLRTFISCGTALLEESVRHPLTPEQERRVLEQYSTFLDALQKDERPRESLKTLLEMDNRLYRLISTCARTYDNGLHPKHRMTSYHKFFCENVGACESVLDIGCGNGFLTNDIAKSTSGRVVGIDKDAANIEFGRTRYQAGNIEFICGDITSDIPVGNFDVVVLSNVLEHLPDRVRFLQNIQDTVHPKKFLIRVPMYEREWMVPLKEELGVDYRLDSTHVLEYTQRQLVAELAAAGLIISHLEIKWGEFWCCARSERQ